MPFHDLVAANLRRLNSPSPVDSRAEDRYYRDHEASLLESILRVRLPVAAVILVLIIVA